MVTTSSKGVFAGILKAFDAETGVAEMEEVRMCVYWSRSVRGVLGLAKGGPDSACKVTVATPSAVLTGVTGVFDCADVAAAAWRAEPWA